MSKPWKDIVHKKPECKDCGGQPDHKCGAGTHSCGDCCATRGELTGEWPIVRQIKLWLYLRRARSIVRNGREMADRMNLPPGL